MTSATDILRARLLLPLLLLTGCSLLGTAIPSPRCERLDDNYLGWSATAAAAGGLAGASSTAAAGVAAADVDDAVELGIGLGVTGAVFSVLATVAGLLSGEYAARMADECMEAP